MERSYCFVLTSLYIKSYFYEPSKISWDRVPRSMIKKRCRNKARVMKYIDVAIFTNFNQCSLTLNDL